MFGIGMTEMLVILVIALVVLGPKKLPELARTLGKSLAELRRASTDLRREFSDLGDEPRREPPTLPRPKAAEEAPAAPAGGAAAPSEPAPPPAPEGRVGG